MLALYVSATDTLRDVVLFVCVRYRCTLRTRACSCSTPQQRNFYLFSCSKKWQDAWLRFHHYLLMLTSFKLGKKNHFTKTAGMFVRSNLFLHITKSTSWCHELISTAFMSVCSTLSDALVMIGSLSTLKCTWYLTGLHKLWLKCILPSFILEIGLVLTSGI